MSKWDFAGFMFPSMYVMLVVYWALTYALAGFSILLILPALLTLKVIHKNIQIVREYAQFKESTVRCLIFGHREMDTFEDRVEIINFSPEHYTVDVYRCLRKGCEHRRYPGG